MNGFEEIAEIGMRLSQDTEIFTVRHLTAPSCNNDGPWLNTDFHSLQNRAYSRFKKQGDASSRVILRRLKFATFQVIADEQVARNSPFN